MFRGAGAGDSPFVAACMGGRTALAIQIMNSKYGYITMRGIVAANRLDVLAASDVPISRLPWGFEDYDYAARLGRREILASILPDIHIHGHNSVFAILAAAANADLFLDLFPITNKKSQAIDQIVQAIRARHEGAVRKLHIGMPREVWPLMFVHEAIKADSIEIARLLLLERGMRLENPLLVAAPWASGRMLEFLHSECGGTYNHHVAFQAADFGNLAALKWIHERLGATLGRMAFDKVVASGKLDAVIWMHETTRLPLTLKNLNKAAISGRLAVVSWIIENKHCEPTTDTLIKAATYGHSDVVLYLAKMGLRFPHRAYVLAAQRCNVEVIKYLHEHGPRAVSWSVMQGQATRHGNTPVSNWLRNRQRDAER
ncbi:hypothetical protein HK105_209083 [Polyrhizophydium stewartii]|uniref:Ankyrin repeat protein n=1 Tax=Polyrhizophydium stewartii TaxID=2732419 RepID=A0ABR4MW03_9FUNG